MTGEKDISDRILVGRSSLQVGDDEPQIFETYQLPPEFPENEKKREVCFDHIREGAASELMGDFDLGGMHFPERDEPQEITTQLSCKGASCILKKCGLTIAQYDTNGVEVSRMKVEQ